MRPVVVQRKSSVLSMTFPWLELIFCFCFSKRVFCGIRYGLDTLEGFRRFFFPFSTDDIHRFGPLSGPWRSLIAIDRALVIKFHCFQMICANTNRTAWYSQFFCASKYVFRFLTNYLRLVDPNPVLVDVVENDGDERVCELLSPAS